MNLEFKSGDNVVVKAIIEHINEDGSLDLRMSNGRIVFNVDPDEVGLIIEET